MTRGRSENILLVMVLVVGCLLTKRDKRSWNAVPFAHGKIDGNIMPV